MASEDPGGELARLTERASQGDRDALEQLLVRYLPRLRAFVRLRTGPELRAHEESSDLVQAVCCDVLLHADRFRFASESAFRQWLFTQALRTIAQRVRHHRVAKRDAGRADPRALDASATSLAGFYASFTTPSEVAAAREHVERVERAFDQLTEEQREVVTLAHLVGLSRAEIGEQLGKSEGAVRVILHRALAKIAELLDT
jgi:RNA polymerase sigma-70 factor (ECF subfamily)